MHKPLLELPAPVWEGTSAQQSSGGPKESCSFVFLDVGASYGSSILQFLASLPPTQYISPVGSKLTEQLHFLRSRYGASAQDFCVVSVEANPAYSTVLKALEAEQSRWFRRLTVWPETLVGATDGETTIWLHREYPGQSSTVAFYDRCRQEALTAPEAAEACRDVGSVVLPSVSLRTLVDGVVADLAGLRVLLLKLDIEGGEFDALAQALAEGLFCWLTSQGAEVHLLIEWHPQGSAPELYGRLGRPWSEQGSSGMPQGLAFKDVFEMLVKRCGVKVADGKWPWEVFPGA
eukprot:TRINITY_DN28581_c0_g1_i1.p1 TRINITY_DN28581_c0_g1~~TRINITY_DN28581_c0_g1_i1.p1  ORF type:complete len:290 (-),score=41.29 TRINITY_DN28581_c0_g1_i1:253-1122(-)